MLPNLCGYAVWFFLLAVGCCLDLFCSHWAPSGGLHVGLLWTPWYVCGKLLNLKWICWTYACYFWLFCVFLVYLCVSVFFFTRKTFRRRVLQKIVGVSHTRHIPHICITPHISHTNPFKPYPTNTYPTNTYPFNTYPTSTYPCNAYPFKRFASAGFAIRIPPIRIPPIRIRSTRIPPIRIHAMRIHSMRIHSKDVHQQESQTYPTNTYPTNTYLQHVSHQYGSIQCVSIQKVCISRNGNEYEYHCISFHTIATRREW